MLHLEYNLLSSEYQDATYNVQNIDHLLKVEYNMFCLGQSTQIDAARLVNHMIAQNINQNIKNGLLDDLRVLKSIILSLEVDDDFDPYLAYLWIFEEDMYEVTEVAMDPMLGLYEWNEFMVMVESMNMNWQTVLLHQPSTEIIYKDEIQNKNQSTYKIFLDKSIDSFNYAVQSDDYETHSLCDNAELLRMAYKDYIYSLINPPAENRKFLAKLNI
jgi:hypothetical protein